MYEWKVKAVNKIYLDENTGGKGRYFKTRFLQPGLVKYSFGVCLLEKETIDKFINDFVGCPVIIGHKDVTSENAKELSGGNICHIWYDEKDGWYWGDGIIDDEEALSLIDSGYNVSCQYEITEYSNNTTNALHNGNPYDKVILNGKPEHLAIVQNPRYENAMIAVNAIDLTAENEDKWITIKPNGEDSKGRHLLSKDGESPKEAIERTYGKETDIKKDNKKVADYKKQIHDKYKSLKTDEEKKAYFDYLDKQTSEFGKDVNYKEAVEWLKDVDKSDIFGKEDNKQQERIDARHKHQEIVKKHNQAYKDFEDGKISMEELEKADKELEKSNKEFYGDGSSDKSDSKSFKEAVKELDKKAEKLSSFEKDYWEAYKETSILPYSPSKEFESLAKEFDDLEKKNKSAKNTIIEAINEIKETNMFKNLFNKKEKQMEKDEMKNLFIDCIQEVLAAQNEAEEKEEKEEVEIKEEKAENKCKNESVDKRKLIDEVAGIMKSAGCDDEVIRTAIAKMEKIGYDKSEADTADNCGKKSKNEDEEDEKEEAKNKAKNSIEALKGLLSQGNVQKPVSKYITKAQAIELGNQLF